ncbi:hypothetical protein PV326_006457 [Microctonus aethiopoides]|nr:hypothetical protein PV326_006457 [Microctonus aethiopoides]
MVRSSTLVYDLLKFVGQQTDGFSSKEILKRVSQAHNITPGKGLKKQINVALRRGIDFGILTRQRNKYRFDSAFPVISVENNEKGKKKKPKKKKAKSSKTKRRKTKTNSKSRGRRITIRKPSQEPPPRPRVMPPPNWAPKKRNLREEPIPKFIRHSDCQKILL